jgi:hypothetical protein
MIKCAATVRPLVPALHAGCPLVRFTWASFVGPGYHIAGFQPCPRASILVLRKPSPQARMQYKNFSPRKYISFPTSAADALKESSSRFTARIFGSAP